MHLLNSFIVEGRVKSLGAFYREPGDENIHHYFTIETERNDNGIIFQLPVHVHSKLSWYTKEKLCTGDRVRLVGELSRYNEIPMIEVEHIEKMIQPTR